MHQIQSFIYVQIIQSFLNSNQSQIGLFFGLVFLIAYCSWKYAIGATHFSHLSTSFQFISLQPQAVISCYSSCQMQVSPPYYGYFLKLKHTGSPTILRKPEMRNINKRFHKSPYFGYFFKSPSYYGYFLKLWQGNPEWQQHTRF